MRVVPTRLFVRALAACGGLGLMCTVPVVTASAANQYHQRLAISGPAGSGFGFDVAINGDTRAVEEEYGNAGDGAVELYKGDPAHWTFQQELTAPDGGNIHGFGQAMAFLGGDTLVIGSPYHNGYQGAVYVFTKTANTWSLHTEITDPASTAFDYFGVALVASDHAFVADGDWSAGGAAYAYTNKDNAWSLQQTIVPTDRGSADFFGSALVLGGDNLFIGSPGHGNGGAFYVYGKSGDAWAARVEVQDPAATPGDFFAQALALDGDTLVVGAPFGGAGVGTAYVYKHQGQSWNETMQLNPSDGTVNDYFGLNVAIKADTIVVGSSNHNGGAGAAYVFGKGPHESWAQSQELVPSDPQPGAFFGWPTVMFDGDSILISAPYTAAGGTLYWFSH